MTMYKESIEIHLFSWFFSYSNFGMHANEV